MTIKDKMTKLESVGCINVTPYVLINNSGFIFDKDGVRYDLIHWQNVYGERVDCWDLDIVNKEFDTFDEAIKYIKKYL